MITKKIIKEIAMSEALERDEIKNCLKCGKEFAGMIYELTCDDCFESDVKIETPHGKDDTKTQFTLVDMDFTQAMAQIFAEGIKENRVANGWKNIKWSPANEARFFDALLRHVHQALKEPDNLKHVASIATNANVIWYHKNARLKRDEK
jgi:hypothetical protein